MGLFLLCVIKDIYCNKIISITVCDVSYLFWLKNVGLNQILPMYKCFLAQDGDILRKKGPTWRGAQLRRRLW